MDVDEMPLPLAKIYTKANNLLNSNIKALTIESYTGINHSTIYRLRNRQRSMSKVTLKSMLLLANYPNKKIVNQPGQKISKRMYDYYLKSAALKYDINFKDIQAKIAEVLSSITNVSHFAKRTGISRSRLSHMRAGMYSVYFQHVDTIAILLNEWNRLVQKGKIVIEHSQA